jgi:tetratricopeptide (TPR) repeat protein
MGFGRGALPPFCPLDSCRGTFHIPPALTAVMSACYRALLALACLTSIGRLHAATLAEAQELYRAKRYAEARTAFEQVAAADPHNAEAPYRLGMLALMRDEQEEAVKWLEKATALAPRSSPYFKALGDAYGLSAQKAGLFSKPGFARKCLAAYEKGVALDPQSVSARYALYTFYRQAPAFAGGGVDKARAQAQEIQKLDVVRGTLALVELSVAGKKYEEAFETLENFRRSHPEVLDTFYQIGRVAALSGLRLDEGAASLKEYLTHTPNNNQPPLWSAHWWLGQIFEKKGDPATARAEYEAALKLNPTQPQLLEAIKRLP